MIPPSGLYRIPRADSLRREEAARYARLEYGGSETAWLVAAARAVQAPKRGIRGWLAALFRPPGAREFRARTPAPSLQGSGVAAIHFAEEERPRHVEAQAARGRGLGCEDTPGTLLLPVLAADCNDELCECEP